MRLPPLGMLRFGELYRMVGVYAGGWGAAGGLVGGKLAAARAFRLERRLVFGAAGRAVYFGATAGR